MEQAVQADGRRQWFAVDGIGDIGGMDEKSFLIIKVSRGLLWVMGCEVQGFLQALNWATGKERGTVWLRQVLGRIGLSVGLVRLSCLLDSMLS